MKIKEWLLDKGNIGLFIDRDLVKEKAGGLTDEIAATSDPNLRQQVLFKVINQFINWTFTGLEFYEEYFTGVKTKLIHISDSVFAEIIKDLTSRSSIDFSKSPDSFKPIYLVLSSFTMAHCSTMMVTLLPDNLEMKQLFENNFATLGKNNFKKVLSDCIIQGSSMVGDHILT